MLSRHHNGCPAGIFTCLRLNVCIVTSCNTRRSDQHRHPADGRSQCKTIARANGAVKPQTTLCIAPKMHENSCDGQSESIDAGAARGTCQRRRGQQATATKTPVMFATFLQQHDPQLLAGYRKGVAKALPTQCIVHSVARLGRSPSGSLTWALASPAAQTSSARTSSALMAESADPQRCCKRLCGIKSTCARGRSGSLLQGWKFDRTVFEFELALNRRAQAH